MVYDRVVIIFHYQEYTEIHNTLSYTRHLILMSRY